ncbi:gliding motility-associated C-terminal domain-containing protein [Allomuricauda sp. SCSIO 65647]|uniref:T9SS type B sorting domain-containing protein n=1 Tax=Allomuricauda sp. SCSIO 65647 TaxID=2908843 RepID=UPI001F490788|nr:gliding motility-associated C-terminal domain-containing protein [Muricauda sp. SCSIO 65647]UJH69081.1 gliding motility-associated C-terminal domain-containing protein [Muricauda sp. SCSIO 65647]
MRPIFPNRILQLVVACMFFGAQVNAQTLNQPTPAPNPNIGSSQPWEEACASESFNEWFVSFNWDPPLVNGDNEFILELSDGDGNFGSPTELARVGDDNIDFEVLFQFGLPIDTRGENYRMRVRSTSPAMTSPVSDAFVMYYIDFRDRIFISQDGNGTIPGTINLCDGNSIVLEPHNVPNADTYRYNWYRSGTLLSETSESLTVSEAGMYYTRIDYGSCSGTAFTDSQIIEITTGTSQGIAIDPPAKTALCPGETETLQANITGTGLTYTWYKDGTAITSPTVDDDFYVVDATVSGFEGDYQVEISGTGICQERSAAVTMTNASNFTVTRDNDATVVILPSQTITLSVSTTASTPTYQWYKDGAPLAGETNSTLQVSDVGAYFARVTESGGACAASPVDSETTNVVAPDSFEFIVDYATSYTSCESTDVTLGLIQINAVALDGSKTDVTTAMQSTFTYQWTRDGSDVSGETSSSLIVANNTDNGSYVLNGTASTYNATSNTLAVQLRSSETIAINSTATVVCQGGDTVVLTTGRDLSGETFEWHRNGADTGSGDTDFTVTQSGVYRLMVDIDGCMVPSNEITINDFDDSQLVLDNENNIVIREGESTTVTATGADTYEWYGANNELISNSDRATFSEEGDYMLFASIGDCEAVRQLTIEFQDNFRVPNVVTANGDGINDLWVLPNTYSRRSDVTVTIYNEKGQEVLNVNDYQNNWPQSSTSFSEQNMVFYYKIRKENQTLKQGTITIIR